MNQLKTPAKPLRWNIFKDIETLTLTESIDNVLFLKYLLSKECNSLIREKYRYYINKLTNRVSELKELE